MKRFARIVGVAAVAIGAVTAANAATVTMSLTDGTNGSAGTPGILPSNFDGSYAGLNANSTPITIFSGAGNDGGLLVSPQIVSLTFDFLGKEAGYTNEARAIFNNALIFNNQSPGATYTATFNVGGNPGIVPFLFRADVTGTPSDALNGGAMASGLGIAFVKLTDSVWYALFDDSGGNPNDHDFDDMVVRITANCPEGGCRDPSPGPTPLPGALWLFGTVIAGGVSVNRWRKRRQTRMVGA